LTSIPIVEALRLRLGWEADSMEALIHRAIAEIETLTDDNNRLGYELVQLKAEVKRLRREAP